MYNTANINTIQGNFQIDPTSRIVVVASRFNEVVVDRLLSGALEAFSKNGISSERVDVIYVPGAFELGITLQQAIRARGYRGAVALGAVIRGETPHFEAVCQAATSAVNQVSLATEVPIAFGVLTTENTEQAMDRAGLKAGNKGYDVAMSLLETMSVIEQVKG